MRAIGIILAGGNSEKLGDLTINRATCALPIGSCYRAIDFPLSNMSNSSISKVAVITQFNSRSLHDHLSSAKWWNFGRKQGGMFIFTPFLSSNNSIWYRGTADSMYQNISFLKRSNEKYVVITSGDSIYKADYQQIINEHEKTEADISLVYQRGADKDLRNYGIMVLDEQTKRLTDFEEKPVEPQSDLISLGIYIIQRTLLIKLLETIVPEGRYDFVKDIITPYRKTLKVHGIEYTGYWSAINSIQSYYNTNMDFLDTDIRNHLIHEYPYIKTKPKDEPPAKYNSGARVSDSLIGSGGILNGYIQRSVLFRKVFTGENTTIRNSVIMEGCYIGNNCVIENAVLDKEVVLSDGKHLIGSPDNLITLKKGTVI